MPSLPVTLDGKPARLPLDAGTRLASLQDAQDYVRGKLQLGEAWCGFAAGAAPVGRFSGTLGTSFANPRGASPLLADQGE